MRLSLFVLPILALSMCLGEVANAMFDWCEKNSSGQYPSQSQSYVNTLVTGDDPILRLYRSQPEHLAACSPLVDLPQIPVEPVVMTGALGALPPVIAVNGMLVVMEKVQNHLSSDPETVIPCACTEAALGIDVNRDSFYNCRSPQDRSPSVSSQSTCKTQEQTNYTHWLMNAVVSCMQNPDKPLNTDLLYLKLTNESGLQTSVCYSGGCGIGQLTTPAIRTSAGVQSNRPPHFQLIDHVRKTPECQPFRDLLTASNRPQKALNLKKGQSNVCEVVYPGSGAAINMMYSIGYMIYLKEPGREMNHLIEFIEQKKRDSTGTDRDFWENEDLLNYAALLAYNMGPSSAGNEAIRILRHQNLRKNGRLDFSYFRRQISQSGSLDYVGEVLTAKPRLVNRYLAEQGHAGSCKITADSINGLQDPAAAPVKSPAAPAPRVAPATATVGGSN